MDDPTRPHIPDDAKEPPAEDAALATISESASFDDDTEAVDDLEAIQGKLSPIDGVKTP